MTLVLRLRIYRKVAKGKFSKLVKMLSLMDGSRFLFSLKLFSKNPKSDSVMMSFISTGGRMVFYFGRF